MFTQAFTRYINNFRGFSREIWLLTLVTFINRSGTMVIPFLSKYLKEDLHFTYGQVGWVMVCFGLGSLAGSWLGGKLSDKIGFYKIMVFSLFTSGVLLFFIQYITSFYGLCLGMFGIMVIADMFRPAMFVSIRTYAKPENRTRAMTLVRLAVNLGMSAGPALAGLIIMGIGYKGLFWADGASCIIAIILFRILVKEKKKVEIADAHLETVKSKSPLRNTSFVMFLFCSFAATVAFFQLFNTLPVYHHEHYGLTELDTGLLISFNGLMIFFFEMPIVGFLERRNIPKLKIILWGSVCIALAFFSLTIDMWKGILLVNMLFLTLGEMFCFRFSNSFALSRASRGQEGQYMAFYTMSFSLAHILSAKIGFGIIASYGYNANWIAMGCIALTAAVTCIILNNRLLKEN